MQKAASAGLTAPHLAHRIMGGHRRRRPGHGRMPDGRGPLWDRGDPDQEGTRTPSSRVRRLHEVDRVNHVRRLGRRDEPVQANRIHGDGGTRHPHE